MSDAMPVVLLVEDEPQIRRFTGLALKAEGWQVFEVDTMRRGLIEAGTRTPDMVVLDLGLPDGDGIEFIKDVRKWSAVPIIVLSARAAEADKIRALDAGADDYMTKPFGVNELLARIRSALRRLRAGAAAVDGTICFGDVRIDMQARIVSRAGVRVHLTPTEYRLLAALSVNAGRVVTNRQLLAEVWGPANADNSHYLRIYIGHLRQKLEVDPARPRYLITETAVGYRLMLPS